MITHIHMYEECELLRVRDRSKSNYQKMRLAAFKLNKVPKLMHYC